jgi:hypothetical protein
MAASLLTQEAIPEGGTAVEVAVVDAEVVVVVFVLVVVFVPVVAELLEVELVAVTTGNVYLVNKLTRKQFHGYGFHLP